MSKRPDSLANKITSLLNTTQSNFNPDEEDDLDKTTAKITYETPENDDNVEEEIILNKFRKQNIDLLSDIDPKYAGKKGSRKKLEEFSEDDSESDDNFENSYLEEKVNSNEDELTQNSESSDNDESDENVSKNINEDANFQHFKETDNSSQLKKGLCVKNQVNLWESLLESRIQLQKCLITANKMPQNAYFNEIKQESGQEFTNKVAETRNYVSNVLDKLLLLQNLVLSKYPETKNLDKPQPNEEDEEIPSDTDEEEAKEVTPLKKRRKIMDYESEINEQFNKYKPYRNNVIQKWNDKTRIVSKTNTHSVLNQIEHNLNDKQRLIKRTQLKRSNYTILGGNIRETQDEKDEYNEEIYDDDDFYHQLLRELIEVKSADLTDPVQLGRQWIQLQNLRKKMKKIVDTKATKGRKIRYAVHTKLVNYMTPIDTLNLWSDEQKNDFFGSLFGKKSAC